MNNEFNLMRNVKRKKFPSAGDMSRSFYKIFLYSFCIFHFYLKKIESNSREGGKISGLTYTNMTSSE